MALPWGEPAWRLGVLNVCALGLAAALLTATLQVLLKPRWYQPWVASLSGLLLGINPFIVQQTLIVEVYILALFFWALLTWLLVRWWHYGYTATIRALGLVFGLGLGVQLPLLAWLAGAGTMWLFERRLPGARSMMLAMLWTVLGLLVYAVLPWRGAMVSTSWGDWTSLQGAWNHMSAAEYGYLVGIVPWNERLARISVVLTQLGTGLRWWGLALALWGILAATPRRGWRSLTAGAAITTFVWAISYGGADSQVYLLPLHLLATYWVGYGIMALIEDQTRSRQVSLLMLVSTLLLWGNLQIDQLSLAHHTSDRDHAIAQLQPLPPNGRISSSDDRTTFPLWYVQRVLNVRPDVHIVDKRLTRFAWYTRQIAYE